MERKTFDEQELNKLPKEMLIRLYIQMAAQLETLTEQNRLHVLEEMLEHEGQITKEYLKTIAPWSASLPERLKVNTDKK